MRALHPAQNRQLRETYAWARQVAQYWGNLAERLPGSEAGPITQGAEKAAELAEQLRPAAESAGVPLGGAAAGTGRSMARAKSSVRDNLLERNQALRFAVEDMQHLTTVLGYGAALAEARGQAELAELQGSWERKLRRVESAARKAAVELGSRPDEAIEPAGSGTGARIGYALGAFGEWTDRRASKKT